MSNARLRTMAGLLAGLLYLASSGAGAQNSRFELDDGSVIIGELQGLDAGAFVIHSPSLGKLRIEQQRVRSMTPSDAQSDSSDAGYAAVQLKQMQQQLAADPAILQMIMGLQNDPQLRAVLADPELMGLVMSGDLGRLRDEPGFQHLMDHPGIRAIIDRIEPR